MKDAICHAHSEAYLTEQMLAHLEDGASQLGALSPTGSVLVSLPVVVVQPNRHLRETPVALHDAWLTPSCQLGVLVGLITTSVQSVGLTLQRKSHLLEDEAASSHPRRPPHRRGRWQVRVLTSN